MLAILLGSGCNDPPSRTDEVEWPSYGGGQHQQKYSPLTEINVENVASLAPAWTYDTHEAPAAGTMHSTPLVVRGRLYLAGPEGGIHALDPTSGARLWVYRPGKREGGNDYFRGAPRGLMYWESGADRRIFGFAGRYVFALDAETGRLEREFGAGGRIDLRAGLGRDPALIDAESNTPGAVFEDLLILGTRMGEVSPTAPGHIRAFDARTGAQRWIFHTIPHPGEPGQETWPADAWRYAGGANNWAGMAFDVERGIVFVPTGSATSDFYGADRPGDNLYANSLIALDARTGRRLWHQQLIRHDLWDRDLPAPPTLVTLQRDGRTIDAVAQVTKTGHVWVFERQTGAPVFPIEEIEAPPSNIPGERAARTQRLPTLPEAFSRQTFTASDVTSRTPEAAAAVRARLAELDPHHPFGPPTLRGRVLAPGFDGGASWGGAAFDPATGVLYVNSNEAPYLLRLVKNPELTAHSRASDAYAAFCAGCHGEDRGGAGEFPSLLGLAARRSRANIEALIAGGAGRMPAFGGVLSPDMIAALVAFVHDDVNGPIDGSALPPTPYDVRYRNDGYPAFVDPDGYPASKPPWGALTAIDLSSGRHVWRRPLGEHPELVARGDPETGSENYGGPVVTAGGVLFIGATVYDRKFRAFDKTTGALLWETTLPAAAIATPAVYEAGGRQFVVIAAGGPRRQGLPRGASYAAFALPNGQ